MLARRDDQVFSREFMLLDAEEFGGYESLFYKTEIRRRHTSNYIRTFDRLMAMAENCDSVNGIIAESLAHTAHGLLYNRMREHQPDELKVEGVPVDTTDYENVFERTRD